MYELQSRPRIGDGWGELGVRPPGKIRPDGKREAADVDVDVHGNVIANKKGMSVFRSLSDLSRLISRLVPVHLASKIRGAAGPAGTRIWSLGTGTFASGSVTENLDLHETGDVHGSVCPSKPMHMVELQKELANTQVQWKIDEPV